MVLSVTVVHLPLFLVISCNLKGNYFQGDQTRGHNQHLGAMSLLIKILPCFWIGHASRVSSNNVKVGSHNHPCSTMPLDLSWDMGRWPPLWSQDSGLLPPALQHASSSTTSRGTSSSLVQPPRGWGRRTGHSCPSLEAAYGYLALIEHGRCALGCVMEMQRQHLHSYL